MVDLLIKDALILTMDKSKRIIQKGAIAVEGSLIVDIGETKALVDKYKPDVVINADGKAALPGLINTHMHIGYCLLKGIASDISDRLSWLCAVYPYVELAKPEDCYYAALLGCLEMIKGGTTFFIENNPFITDPRNMDSIATAVEEIGIRAAIGRMFSDINAPSFLLNDTEELKSEMKRLYKTWHGRADGRIQIWIYAPGPGMRESQERMVELLRIAREYDIKLSSHWAEGGEKLNRQYYLDKYRTNTPTQFLLDAGYLGPNTLLVHVVDVGDEEIQMLAETDTNVSHCPTSNMARASYPLQISPVSSMLKVGVSVGLGTDASICNDKSSMFEAMKQAILLQKLRLGDPKALTADKALEMATVNGAKIVGMEKQIGTLEVGKRADIVLIDIKKPHILPIHNIYENIVYCANESDVDTVVINGKVVMENRKVKTIDEDYVTERIVSITADLDKKAKERAKSIAKLWQESYKERFKPKQG